MAAGSTASCTVTGTAGAGIVVTAKVFTNIIRFTFDVVNALFIMTDVNDKVITIAIGAATTVTVTLSAANANYTVTIT